MSNKKIEYNPLFESLSEVAKRYERIGEQENTESDDYKLKSAKDYAIRILQMIYDEYLYFLNSVPSDEFRKKYKEEIITFMDTESKKTDVNMELLVKSIMDKWKAVNKSESVTKASEKSEAIRNSYSTVEMGISKLDELVKTYTEKYKKEMMDPSVAKAIKDFTSNALINLQKA